MRYRDLSVKKILKELLKPKKTLILCHRSPDADAIGSALALSLFLRSKGKEAYCLCQDEIPQRLRFLADGIQESLLPESCPAGFEGASVVTVDSASPEQLGTLYKQFGARITLMIDHHGTGIRYADGLVRGEAAACGEILYDIFAAAGKKLPEGCATLLYAAIASDTGGFRHSNTTAETHVRAAALVKEGIDVAELSHRLFGIRSMAELRAERLGFDKLHLFDDGKIGISSISFEDKQFNKLCDEDLSTVVDVVRSVSGVEIAVAIRQPQNDTTFRVSMRANVDFNVAAVCAEFGGGGHRRAAGATLIARDTEEAERLILAAIHKRR